MIMSWVGMVTGRPSRSEEHTSELQSRQYLACRLLLEKITVCFSALVLYTSPSRALSGRELCSIVQDFESLAAAVIARPDLLVAKIIVDCVLSNFTVPS